LVKRKLRKPPESWHWRLPKKPGRDSALDPIAFEIGSTGNGRNPIFGRELSAEK
jgi:hypothetical protein